MTTAEPRVPSVPKPRSSRRRAVQALAAGAGGLLFLGAAWTNFGPFAAARVDDDDDSARGDDDRRGDGGDDRGHGGGDAEAAAPVAAIPAGSVEIRIVSDDAGGFVPGELTVDLGQAIAFVNAHSDEHTATGSGFDTGIIPESGVATVVMEEPGVFAYACQIHPVMTGRVSVRDESGVVPQAVQQEVPAGATTVSIANLAFDPAEISVSTGSIVVWSNDDAVPHTATSVAGVFDSGIFDPGATFSWTFGQPGTFPYVCQLHPRMQGTVVVSGEATVPAPAAEQAATPGAVPDGVPADATPAPGDTGVAIVDFAFEPATLEVAPGSTVVWTNTGAAPHTVTGEFADSGTLEPGGTFQHTFDTEGEFAYVCSFHPQMVGTVSVRAGEASAAQTAAGGGATADLAGVWSAEIALDDGGEVPSQTALLTLHSDGTLAADFAASSEAAPSLLLGDGHGQWVAGENGLELALMALASDADGRLVGTVTMRGQAATDAGDTLTGDVVFDLTSPSGDSVATGTGQVSGSRLDLGPGSESAP